MNYIPDKNFKEIREYLNEIPVLETHEHYTGIMSPVKDVLNFIMGNYYLSDFLSSDPGAEKSAEDLNNVNLSFDERYQIFRKYYDMSCHTAYGKAMVRGLKECWDEDLSSEKSFYNLEEKFKTRDQSFYCDVMEKHNIKGKIVNTEIRDFVSGKSRDFTQLCRFALPLPQYHHIHTVADIKKPEFGSEPIRTVDEYMAAFERYLVKCMDFGIVAMKDQTAYRRDIAFTHGAKSEAEKIFNRIVSNPRDVFGTDEVRPLDDWLFGEFLKLAAKYRIPVQIHTGHMAGIRNEISKTNAVGLTTLIEMYPDVVFDLFHGNWPYMGELLFMGKNYPNVVLDLCWVQAIDPLYSIELMKRALVTVPSSKLLAFGGDTTQPEWVVGYLLLAKDNTARALSHMVDSGWISLSRAKQVALDWFYTNVVRVFSFNI